jgi:hypothetical protein
MNSRDFHSIYWWLFFLACTSLVLFGVISLTWRHSGKGNPDSDHGSAVEGRSRTQAELQACATGRIFTWVGVKVVTLGLSA